jgi:acyl carrier protein
MHKVADVESEVWRALKAVVSPNLMGSGANRESLLREDLNMGSLALVSVSMEICDRCGVDPAALDLGFFLERAKSVGDLIEIAEEVLAGQ